MGKFDLSKPGDFANAIAGAAGGLLSQFGERNPKDWDIQEASYSVADRAVRFHIFKTAEDWQGSLGQVSDKGGRRKVMLKYPYRDGQTTDDLGREPEEFQMDIVLFGSNYKNGLSSLLNLFNDPRPGQLIHPVRGVLTVVPVTWNVLHKSDSRKAAAVQATFVEHNFTLSKVPYTQPDKSVKSAIGFALKAISKIQDVILNVNGAVKFGQSFINQVLMEIDEFKTGYAQVLASINATFNIGSASEFPALLPVNQGGIAATDGTYVTDNFSVASTTLSEVTLQALSSQEIEKKLNENRSALDTALTTMKSAGGGQGALEFYADILTLKNSAIALQEAFEKGVASSQAKIVRYKVPRLMSVRELAFLNGVPLSRASDIDVLNPQLASLNFIEAGTVVKVPVS